MNRAYDSLRQLCVTYDIFDHADGSLLFEMGNTKVMCAVTMQPGVPQFMRGEKSGWLTAEYAMLPASTRPRTQRDGQGNRLNQRNIEISRIIGRTLRTMCDLGMLGEYTIVVDCDVLQADAGTRAACISAAAVALQRAEEVWLRKNIIQHSIIKKSLVAVAVGLMHSFPILDPDYAEEMLMDADLNFILDDEGSIVEIQGGAEKNSFSWDQLTAMYAMALRGTQEILAFFGSRKKHASPVENMKPSNGDRVPFFSLQSRSTFVKK